MRKDIAIGFLLLAGGCLGGAAPPHAARDTAPDDATVLAWLANGDFRGRDFVKVNRAPYPSTLVDGANVNVYVSWSDAAVYQLVQPGIERSDISLQPGLTVVREVQDGSGQTQKLTVMVRHLDGYFPGGGDFLYGVTTTAGAPMDDPHSGEKQWGKLETCGSCHAQRAGDAFLFGVPASVR